MTRKEAIEILKAYPLVIKDQQAIQEAIEMAIASLETDEGYQLEYEKPSECKTENLCDSCGNRACEFQSGIKRSSCDFYMPHLRPDYCGKYQSQWYGEPIFEQKKKIVSTKDALKDIIPYSAEIESQESEDT